MLSKVISGGQTGVDQAALRAAQGEGIPTGGYAPRFYRTLDGPNLSLRDKYGLEELASYDYASRTERNVIESDATLRIARHFHSPGEQATLRYLIQHGKPFIDVKELRGKIGYSEVERVVNWIEKHSISVLNVAGNSERTAPGIKTNSAVFLRSVFQLLNLRK